MNDYFKGILERKRNFKIIGSYGVKFLDDYLLGILQEDFVLIGSATGEGKTELAYEIAFLNAIQGSKVHLFAIEADEDEPYNRRIYKKISKHYFEDIKNKKATKILDMNYRNYITNKIDITEYEEIACEEIQEESKNLRVHYRKGDFTINTLIQKIKEIENDCDLIVFDHVDYFDFNTSINENIQMTEIMKQLRNINQVYRIPIVLISHLRKKINNKSLMPTMDDFFGSSNKAKQAKTVILIGRDSERDDYIHNIYGSLMSIPKARIGGSCRLVARLLFDARRNKYENEYVLSRLNHLGTELTDLEYNKYPNWVGGKNELQNM